MDKQYFLDTFNVTEPGLEELTASALAHGGAWADLYFENTLYGDLLLKDGQVTSGGLHTDFGVGIRVLSGEKTGYAYSENTAPQDMKEAAAAASLIASGSSGGREPGGRTAVSAKAADCSLLYPESRAWSLAQASGLVPFLEKLQERILFLDSRAIKIIARISYSHSDIMMFNSYGELTCDSRPMGSVTASVIFSNGTRSENKTVSRSFRCGE